MNGWIKRIWRRNREDIIEKCVEKRVKRKRRERKDEKREKMYRESEERMQRAKNSDLG
jgi:hypothetical protein